VLTHKERSWAAQLPDVELALARWTAAAATLAGADTSDEAHALLAIHPALAGEDARPRRDRLIRWWADTTPGSSLLNPLGPDRLGEDLVERALASTGDHAGDVLDGLLRLPVDRQVADTLDLLERAHAGHPRLARLTDAALIRNLPGLARRATAASAASAIVEPAADRASSHACDGDVGGAVLRLLSPSLLERIAPHGSLPPEPPDQRQVSEALCDLADVAADRADLDRAQELLDASVRLDEARLAAAPDALDRRRAVALDRRRLAELDRRADRPLQAEGGYRRFLEAAEDLVRRDPTDATYRQDVVAAHMLLGDLDRDAGRTALADAGYRRALDARQELLRLEPGNRAWSDQIAAAWVQLGDLDAAAGWSAQAEAGYRHALDVFEGLARQDPGHAGYRRGAAIAQQRLAVLHPDVPRPVNGQGPSNRGGHGAEDDEGGSQPEPRARPVRRQGHREQHGYLAQGRHPTGGRPAERQQHEQVRDHGADPDRGPGSRRAP
jgi:tetratricopeptide (TPR) repeat protein